MKILVTGGAGYIGSHTCVELLNEGYEVVIVDNLYNASEKAVQRVQEITGKELTFYNSDIRDYNAMSSIFSKEKPDAVIHFAGKKAVGESVAKPLMYYKNNLDATMNLLEVMQRHDVNKLIFSSSATVYGVPKVVPIDEKQPTWCTNPYGWTKYMSEQIMRDVCAANPKLSIVLLRYFNPIGAHESGRIGEDPKGIPNNLMPYISQVAIGRREKLSVFGNDYDTHDGTGVRDYIHVVDLAKGHLAALKYAQNENGCVEINLGTGIGYSVLDIVHAFEKANNIEIPYAITERRPGDIDASFADAHLAAELLHWHTEKTLEDMCRDTWRWQQMNPNGYREE